MLRVMYLSDHSVKWVGGFAQGLCLTTEQLACVSLCQIAVVLQVILLGVLGSNEGEDFGMWWRVGWKFHAEFLTLVGAIDSPVLLNT